VRWGAGSPREVESPTPVAKSRRGGRGAGACGGSGSTRHRVVHGRVLMDKRHIPLRSASVRTPHLFHHGIPKVLVNPRSKGITSVQSTTH
jgi:hypothetical protein